MINIKFLQTICIRNQVERLRELENDLEEKKSLDLLTDSLDLFFKEMYGMILKNLYVDMGIKLNDNHLPL